MIRDDSALTVLVRGCTAVRSTHSSIHDAIHGTSHKARLVRTGGIALVVLLIVAIEPAVAQETNPVCDDESETLVNMIEGFIQITTALGLMGLLIVWQADELADMFTMDQQQTLSLKKHKRKAMKSASILVILGPLFTIAGSAMDLPIAQCVDLIPF